MTFKKASLEVCIDSFESASNALAGSADRIEVCSILACGGLTPSAGLVRLLRKKFPTSKLYSMLRPRPSDFIYTENEILTVLEDIVTLRQAGSDGFVFGALVQQKGVDDQGKQRSGQIDVESCRRIIAATDGLPVTFHRAFDQLADWKTSLETIIDLGFSAILTSGLANTAHEGLEVLRGLVEAADGRIEIIAGGGVNHSNTWDIQGTGVDWVHASCSGSVIQHQKNTISMGAFDPDITKETCIFTTQTLKNSVRNFNLKEVPKE